MKRNRFFTISAVAVILSVLAVTMLATPALAAPVIVLSPESGSAGTTVTINGANFISYAGDRVHVYFGGIQIAGSPLTVPANGDFSINFQVPDNIAPGRSYITVRDKDGNQIGDSMPFFVPKPDVRLNVVGGVVGTSVTLSGVGFHAGDTINFYYSNGTATELGTVVATPVGECTYIFAIPDSTGGGHTVAAKDLAGNRAEVVFTVIPSIILDPISGAIGDKITVTGAGFGYNSHVVIDFGEEQVAVDKTDENGSFKATFSVPDTKLQTYSVQAKDTEGNVVDEAFTITAGAVSFVFPQWGIYVAIAFGGLVLFFFGFWLGRRYSYTY